MSTLTGRYKLERTLFGGVRLVVEDHLWTGFYWRPARASDFPKLEPMVADGWRFVEERNGHLMYDGKRIKGCGRGYCPEN